MTLVMTCDELNALLAREFPQVAAEFAIESVTDQDLVARFRTGDAHLRPGGTISGPTMFALADLAIYSTILAHIGPVILSVTTGATIDFLRKPAAGRDLIARCRLLKLGRTLAVGDALIQSAGEPGLIARASMTYAIPSQRQATVLSSNQ